MDKKPYDNKTNLGVTLGAIGTGLGVLNAHGGILSNLFGGGGAAAACPDNQYVNRYELTMAQELAAKDGKIALLEADKYTDQKIIEAYKDLQGQIGALSAEVRANKEEQNQVNMNQAVFNGTVNSTISCIQGQINQLMGLTKLVVPNSSICPGWGNVNITPAPTGTTIS